MTVADASASQASRHEQPVSLVLTLFIGFMGCLLFSWEPIKTVWLTGAYGDTDDAMRMVQVRDWLAGQGWYDLRALRLDPPTGVVMHWSRLVDLPIAGLIRLFGLIAEQETAERLTRIVFPVAMQGLLLVGACLCGRLLAGGFGGIIAVLLTLATGMSFIQFVPGRIDHHAPQIVLLMLMVYACLCGLDPQRPRMAALAGLCAALSLAIAIENLPFILVLMAVFPVAWALQGACMRAALVWMGAGFAASLLFVFALFQSPALWTTSACDALSAVHIRAALAGGTAMVFLAIFDHWRKPEVGERMLATGLVGLLAALPLVLDRQCFLDPFHGLDPLVRELWLSHVQEAFSLPKMLSQHPGAFWGWVTPWALGVAAIALAAVLERGLARARFVALLALALAGCAAACYMVRSINNVSPLAVLGGVWLVARLRQACGKRERLGVIAILMALPPFMPMFWVLAAPVSRNADEAKRSASGAACLTAEAFTPLQGLPAGPILALPGLGPFVLLYTDHSVVAGPYHRNNHGNRLMFDVFLAPPETAREMLRVAGLRYIALCNPAVGAADLIERAPEGLAGAIAADAPLPWLRRIEAQTPLRLYEIVRGP